MRLTRLFPALTEEFYSPLAPAELLGRVQGLLAAPTVWTWRNAFKTETPTAPFRGAVQGSGFTMQRIIDYRNSMLPRISGAVRPAPGRPGSVLELKHQLHPFVLAFAAVWLMGVGSAALATLGAGIGGGGLDWPSLIPVGMLVVGLALFTVPFWLEVGKSRPLLIDRLALHPLAT